MRILLSNNLLVLGCLAISFACGNIQTFSDAAETADSNVGENTQADAKTTIPDAASVDANATTSMGCTDGQGLSEGQHTFTLEGISRQYLVRLPNGYTADRAWPVLFALHPNGSNATYWDVSDGNRNIRGIVDNEAILIIAEAIGGHWRDYDQAKATWPARLETELKYFDQVLAEVSEYLCIDTTQIFSMGFSGGGSFSGVLACRRNYIRAFAGGGAVTYFNPADCVQAPPAWITIGTEELNAGRTAFLEFFRDGAACEQSATPTEPSPCVAYNSCNSQTPVHYCQHAGGHIWPNFGTTASWEFLTQFID